jgi:hypothetical protein
MLPQQRRVVAGEVGAQQVPAFPPPDDAQFPPVNGELEGFRGDFLAVPRQADIDQVVGPYAPT